ncbi:double-strand break repair protein AddB [Elioraea sp.]|uniref:double-strand break repair protein AddB n=1 Tax=Elioraea sp. TaxID=2185103 RepID=UPI0025C5B11A|nr:double-strand break repair protein AddB [Elioraea sp.]
MPVERRTGPRVLSIPAHAPFLDALAAGLWQKAGEQPAALARITVLLPTRRAARGLAEAFLRLTEGQPLLLPRVIALAEAADEAAMVTGIAPPAPAIGTLRRQAALARLVMAKERSAGITGADHHFRLAGELATLLDEIAREEADPARLADAADAAHAEHWQRTVEFLEIVTAAWPAYLAEAGVADPAARLVAMIDARRRAWEEMPPTSPVIAAGSTGSIPAIARLLRVVSRLPDGAVVLPGLDTAMAEEAWESLADGHPQAALKRLLAALDITRGDVAPWPAAPAIAGGTPARADSVARAMLPAAGMSAWREVARERVREGIAGIARIDAADENEEALAIALAMRLALETPGRRAALVTTDRDIAQRVASALTRFGLRADDSAGRPLRATPPAVFLRLLVAAVAENLAPLPLLSLLKHPLAACGMSQARFRAAVRLLEVAILRGPRPGPGLDGLDEALVQAGRRKQQYRPRGLAAVTVILDKLRATLAPLLGAFSAGTAPADRLLEATLAAAEALAATDTVPGAARLWAQEAGEALAERMAEAAEALAELGPLTPEEWPGLFEALLEGAEVRLRRQGSAGAGAPHPRLFIWGALEARLQSVDVAILAGLNENTWPAAVDPGPWLSRPMRQRFGLAPPEAAIGQAAHDVTQLLSCCPQVILTRSRRVDGAPTVPSRWLVRLDAFLKGQLGEGDHLRPTADLLGIARALDAPERVTPEGRPMPRPALALRPRRLAVTDIERWLRDPFEIYARHILGLRALAEIDEPVDGGDWGSLVHDSIAAAIRRAEKDGWPVPATFRQWIIGEGAQRFATLAAPARAAFWRPRLARIAGWVAETDADRRRALRVASSHAEIKGEMTLPDGFVLHGRADRIDVLGDGTLALIDYKTGAIPKALEIREAYAIQLTLEAAMAEQGAFAAIGKVRASMLEYWRLTGGHAPAEVKPIDDDVATLAAGAWKRFEELRARFADPATPYLARPHPHRAPEFSDYMHLARVAEWGGV